jgi:hypothetical protein
VLLIVAYSEPQCAMVDDGKEFTSMPIEENKVQGQKILL